ncbi:TVP38/TMEM64 family protein [Clostridium sp. 19966]|nr:TVP38/TMEM64 family protein [Clostridium sp. 19966]
MLIVHKHKPLGFNLHHIRRYLMHFGKFTVLAILIIYMVKPVGFILPTSAIAIATGGIYGVFLGTVISLVGCFLSSTVAFYISRFLGKGFVEKFTKGKALQLEDNIEKHGFKIMFFMRLSIIFPFDALSYAAGLSKIKYKDFILGTVIGVIPEMISYSSAGKHLDNPISLQFILPFIIIILFAMLFSMVTKKSKKF